jgi:hypothetical protein
VFSLAAGLAFFAVTLGAATAAFDTAESAAVSGSVQEPGAMMLTGLALLGLAFVARQLSGKNRPGPANQ